MPVKKRANVKKSVTFSDDTTLSHHNTKKKNIDHDHPPVFVRKTIRTVPWHIIGLLYYYIYLSDDYDTMRLLYLLIPSQVLYLVFQFNSATIYGNKILKINYTLILISLSATILLTVPTLLMIIVFGAPLVEKLRESWLLALHACYLAYPAVYSLFNCDFKVGIWKIYFIFIVLGGWISCVVIPLDWDREWQAWPIPVIVGSYLGAFVGYSISAFT
ncbi:hypothetical protein Kpol_1023p43 [Vanderwaltozyma polyspora DSM 70294]|uniref:Glycosylphosphatidylinositol anchor biosynthesis protein 11 n=1 Tax=Vanderwaltozyma polyspora (strain ATCC 22028 / DSM 70294 / BCRC 21397 / CBS 2163 / NBRC 10782 / NRRL Y-8283 / UCD 57-17) TaxID=436907 RepID=A7TFR6_VANPO|nr:uncharacterized protein Kpol_1023p43 [Vanderwaltozyma polyspora DSM 70294]EDO18874.1 hypothetical protein Kpol_1023p43 [Vanderwaltozyma polyspora DSM 70294]